MQCTKQQRQTVQNQVMAKVREIVAALIERQTESDEVWTLKEKEGAVLGAVTEVGNELLGGLLKLHETPYVPDVVSCQCGGQAAYQRRREGSVQTIVGKVGMKRAYYLCPECHQGCYPLDQELEFCAGGLSAGLEESAALAGVVEPFASGADLLERLLWTGVRLSHNRVRGATEDMGRALGDAEANLLERAFGEVEGEFPGCPEQGPERLYISVDGTCVRCEKTEEQADEEEAESLEIELEDRDSNWREAKVAALYETEEVVTAKGKVAIKAKEIEYYADIGPAQDFARLVWLKAYQRGVRHAQEIVLLGDGAKWIWKRLLAFFPRAIQILDWYHVRDYVVKVAQAVFGADSPSGKTWSQRVQDLLWAGHVSQVIQDLKDLHQAHPRVESIEKAISYFTNNKQRMNYPDYRARGLQIGSGTIESGCKRVVKARLDQAGMTWAVEGARAVLKARAAYLSGQWDDFWQRRTFQPRAYRRQAIQKTRLAA
ncbi:MAG: ISKra4 family transposase [Candidatus Promineifilaceae bacterium]|jgi:hypothetical protein